MYKTFIIATISLVFLCSCGGDDKPQTPPTHRGVYHWKTTYNPTAWEKLWMKNHNVDRLYIKLFDVEVGNKANETDWKMVPVATTVFKQKLPKDMEVIPVIYITVDAIRALDADAWSWGDKERYAKLIVKRIDDMMAEHYEGTIREVQLDCDWTQQTEHAYFMLARQMRGLLHKQGITLSGTLRFHQLREVQFPSTNDWGETDSIPFDRSLLMCYNTGRLQDHNTKNSILDFDDVKPYLKQYHSDNLPRTDVAYPVYTWGVDFDDEGNFVRLVNSQQIIEEKCHNLRVETGEPREIRKTQRALPILDSTHTTILYHLDSLNLSRYSYEDIEEFYSR